MKHVSNTHLKTLNGSKLVLTSIEWGSFYVWQTLKLFLKPCDQGDALNDFIHVEQHNIDYLNGIRPRE